MFELVSPRGDSDSGSHGQVDHGDVGLLKVQLTP